MHVFACVPWASLDFWNANVNFHIQSMNVPCYKKMFLQLLKTSANNYWWNDQLNKFLEVGNSFSPNSINVCVYWGCLFSNHNITVTISIAEIRNKVQNYQIQKYVSNLRRVDKRTFYQWQWGYSLKSKANVVQPVKFQQAWTNSQRRGIWQIAN